MAYDGFTLSICEQRLRQLSDRIPERTNATIWPGVREPEQKAIYVGQLSLDGIPTIKQNRDQLSASIPSLNEEVAFLAIMAWGGQKDHHTLWSWNERNKWIPILTDLRSGQLSPVEAYDRFYHANIRGLGPAFYTKLIFFLQHEKYRHVDRGFIMDQWTAKSMELLHAHDRQVSIFKWMSVQKAQPHGIDCYHASLSKKNGAEKYAQFCNFVTELHRQLNDTYGFNHSPDAVEEAIFAGSPKGKPPLPWREFTMRNWHQ